MRTRGTTKGVLRGIVWHNAATLRSEKGSDDRIWGWDGIMAFLAVGPGACARGVGGGIPGGGAATRL